MNVRAHDVSEPVASRNVPQNDMRSWHKGEVRSETPPPTLRDRYTWLSP